MPAFQPVRRERLADQVVHQLRRRLAAGEFAVGQKLPPEPELMAQLAVGRTTIREAVRALAHAGYLDVRQGDGTYVRALDPGQDQLAERLRQARVPEVYELRRALELEMARLAALRWDGDDLARIHAALERLQASVGPGQEQTFLEADLQLKLAVAAATHNAVLLDLYQAFTHALRAALAQVVLLPGIRQVCAASQQRLVEALARRDPGAAQTVAARHLDEIAALLEPLVAAAPPAADRARRQDAAAAASPRAQRTA